MTFKSSFSVHDSRKDPSGLVLSVPVTWKQDGKENTETLTSFPGSNDPWLQTVKVIDWDVTCFIGSSDCKVNLTFMVDFENFLEKRPKGTDIRVALRLESTSLFGGNSQTSSKSDAVQPLWLFPPKAFDMSRVTAGDKTVFVSEYGFMDTTMDMGGTVEVLYRLQNTEKWLSNGRKTKADYRPQDFYGNAYIRLTGLTNDRAYEVKVVVTGPGGSTESDVVVVTPHLLGPPKAGSITRIGRDIQGADLKELVVYFQKGGSDENPVTGFVIDFGKWPLDKYKSRTLRCKIPEGLTYDQVLTLGICPVDGSFFSNDEMFSNDLVGFRLRTVNAKGDWQNESVIYPFAFRDVVNSDSTSRARAYLTGVTQATAESGGRRNVDVSAALTTVNNEPQPFDNWDAEATTVKWTARQVSGTSGQSLETLTGESNAKLTTVTNSVPSMVKTFAMRAGGCYEMSWSVKAVANGETYPTDLASGPSKEICVGKKPSAPSIAWIEQETPESVEVYWSPSSDASVHTISLLKDGKIVETQETSKNSVFFKSLTPGSLYTVQGRSYLGTAVDDTGIFSISDPKEFRTAGAVTNLTVESGKKAGETTKLTWSPPEGVDASDIDYYRVLVDGPNVPYQNPANPTVGELSYTLPYATAGSAYEFSVSAILNQGVGVGPETKVGLYTGTLPSAPTSLTAQGTNSGINATWNAPATLGTPPLTGYRIETRSPGGEWTVAKDEIEATTLAGSIDNLDPNLTYDIRVIAVSSIGDSEASNVVTAKMLAAPSEPQKLELAAHDKEIVATWQEPSESGDGEITEYELTWTPDQGNATTVALPASANTHKITGLTNGVEITVSVSAKNVHGFGPKATTKQTPATTPGPVTNLSVTHSLSALNVTWEAPNDTGGSAVTGYIVEKQNGDGTWGDPHTTSTTALTLNGLANGTPQTIRVCAINSAGTSSQCVTETGTPRGVPGLVPNATLTALPNAVRLDWGDGTEDNGAAITNYRVDQMVGGTWKAQQILPATDRSVTISGLTNGQPWTGRVVAQNSEGWSQVATTLTSTPADVPDTPTVKLSARDSSVFVTVSANGTGGATVSSARVMWREYGGQWRQLAGVVDQAIAVHGLENGTTYEFKATVSNAVGSSEESLIVTTSPFGTPKLPALNVVVGDREATLTWTENDNGSAVTARRITLDGVLVSKPEVQPLTMSFGDLTNGQKITICVFITNAAGESGTCVVATPRTVPDPPTIDHVGRCELGVPCGTTLRLGLTNGNDGGAPITGYALIATSTNGDALPTVHIDKAAVQNPITVPGMTLGETYAISVSAINAAGTGQASASFNYTPVDPPAQARLKTATTGNKKVELAWETIADGGSALTTTTVEWRQIGGTWNKKQVSGTETTIEGLTNGTAYEFRVSGTNAVGTGPVSVTTTAVPSTTPGAPNITSVSRGNAKVTVEWDAPSENGGANIIGYSIDWSTDGTTWSHLVTVPETAQTATLTGLQNGVPGVVRVRALNGNGSTQTLSTTVTPAREPDPVRNLTAVPGSGHAVISWDAPASDGGEPVTYQVSVDGGNTYLDAGATTHISVAGINGTEMHVIVRARNVMGFSPDSTTKTTPRTKPTSVQGLTATDNGDGTLHIEWSRPDNDGGSPITGYTVEVEGSKQTVTGTSATVRVPSGVKVVVKVAAENAAGSSHAMDVEVTGTSVPNAPQKLETKSGNTTAKISWSEPANGGKTITHYVIQRKTATGWVDALTVSKNNAELTGLENGVPLELRVIAFNANGGSTPSAQVDVTPYVFAPVITVGGKSVTPGLEIRRGSALRIDLERMPKGTKIRAELHSTPTKIGEATAGANGRVALDAIIPNTFGLGAHTLVVIGEVSGEQISVKIPVKIISETSTDSGAGGSNGSGSGSSGSSGSGSSDSGSGDAGPNAGSNNGNTAGSGSADGNSAGVGSVGDENSDGDTNSAETSGTGAPGQDLASSGFNGIGLGVSALLIVGGLLSIALRRSRVSRNS